MRILVLGGTLFLGRHIVEAALSAGHEVTLFNRGQTNPHLYPEAEKLIGDRTADLSPLAGRHWDAVVDTSGYVPRVVRASSRLLAESVAHYTFVSSLSVYRDFSAPITETSPVATLEDELVEEVTGATYGALKTLCEHVVEEAFPGRSVSARAGLIVGPYDPLNRFPYWLKRIPRGGEVLAPGSPTHPVQLIDARDLAEWVLRCAQTGVSGAFNVTGPAVPCTLNNVLSTITEVTDAQPRFTWVPDDFLQRKEVQPLDGAPLWAPEEYRYFFRADIDRALRSGLTFRPLAETVRDTLAWLASDPPQQRGGRMGIQSGLSPDREAELLAEWRGESGGVSSVPRAQHPPGEAAGS
jgi:2'-hydroxyisoflavone reductase